jgi:hypothetical protein
MEVLFTQLELRSERARYRICSKNITIRGDKNRPPQVFRMMDISKPIIAYRGFPLPASSSPPRHTWHTFCPLEIGKPEAREQVWRMMAAGNWPVQTDVESD